MEQSEHLQQLDEELKENHVDLLKRFYRLFESMHRFVTDLTAYIGDLDDGVFIQQSLETVFLDTEGKQLLVCRILKMHFMHLFTIFTCGEAMQVYKSSFSFFFFIQSSNIENNELDGHGNLILSQVF